MPSEETTYRTAMTISTVRRPSTSVGRPTAIEPTIVPSSALATVKPSQNEPGRLSQLSRS